MRNFVTKLVPHFALRKLSTGVASVLLGTTIYCGVAHADTVNNTETETNSVAAVDQNASQLQRPTVALASSANNNQSVTSQTDNSVTTMAGWSEYDVNVNNNQAIVVDNGDHDLTPVDGYSYHITGQAVTKNTQDQTINVYYGSQDRLDQIKPKVASTDQTIKGQQITVDYGHVLNKVDAINGLANLRPDIAKIDWVNPPKLNEIKDYTGTVNVGFDDGSSQDVSVPIKINWVCVNPEAGKYVKADGSSSKLPDVIFKYEKKTSSPTVSLFSLASAQSDNANAANNLTKTRYIHLYDLDNGQIKTIKQVATLPKNTENAVVDSVHFNVNLNYQLNNETKVSTVIDIDMTRDGVHTDNGYTFGRWKNEDATIAASGVPLVNLGPVNPTTSIDPKVLVYNQAMSLNVDAINKLVPGYHLEPSSLTSFVMNYYINDQSILPFNGMNRPYTVNFKLVPNSQSNVINYVLQDGTVVYQHPFYGVTDQTVDLELHKPVGYKVVEGQNIPTTYTFKATDNQPVKILVEPTGEDVSQKWVFIDEDNWAQPVGPEKTATGPLNSKYQIADSEIPENYKLDNGQQPEVLINPNGTALVQIKLRHKTTHYLSNPQTRTITHHWVFGDGPDQGKTAAPDSVVDVYFGQYTIKDLVTGDSHIALNPVITNGQTSWALDESKGDAGSPGIHLVSGQWNIADMYANYLKHPELADIANLPTTLGSNVTLQTLPPKVTGYEVAIEHNRRFSGRLNTEYVSPYTHMANWVEEGYTEQWRNSGSEKSCEDTSYFYIATQTLPVIYKDGDQVVNTQNVTGKTWTSVDLSYTAPDGYVIVDGQNLPTSYTFKPDDNLPILVQVSRQVNSSIEYQFNGETIASTPLTGVVGTTTDLSYSVPDGYAIVKGQNLPTSYEFKASGNQPIVVQLTDQAKNTIEYQFDGQTIKTDTITGKIGDSKNINYIAPDGYAIAEGQNLPTSYEFKANGNQPIIIKVNKLVNQTINFVDLNSKIVASQQVNGEFGDTFDVTKVKLPAGYELASKKPLHLDDGTVTVQVKPMLIVVSPSADDIYGKQMVDGIYYPQQVANIYLQRTKSRNITVMNPIPNRPNEYTFGFTVKQEVHFERTAIVNVITGEITYSDWKAVGPAIFESYVAPHLDGYVSDVVPSDSADTRNSMILVYYHKVDQPKVPLFVDNTGKTYDAIPDGYHVASNQTPSQGTQLILKDVTPVAPKIEFVTRTVNIELPNGKVRTIHQKAMKGKKFGNLRLPKLRGYHEVVTGGDITDNAANGNVTITVKFEK